MDIRWTDKNGEVHTHRHEFFLAYSAITQPDGQGGYLVPSEFAPVVEEGCRQQRARQRVTLTGLVLKETARVYGLGGNRGGR